MKPLRAIVRPPTVPTPRPIRPIKPIRPPRKRLMGFKVSSQGKKKKDRMPLCGDAKPLSRFPGVYDKLDLPRRRVKLLDIILGRLR